MRYLDSDKVQVKVADDVRNVMKNKNENVIKLQIARLSRLISTSNQEVERRAV